jgi:hypothetical protein
MHGASARLRRGRHACGGAALAAAASALVLASSALAATAPPDPPGLNQREARAHAIWTLRAGLNVAALQCQFSPFLMAVPNYNALLRQHTDEMGDAFKTLTGFFVRTQGPRTGQRAFDTYATRTNQTWATFDAQYSFCDAAALLGRRALAVPKGKFGEFAEAEVPTLRRSLDVPRGLASPLASASLTYVRTPALADPCVGRPLSKCR